MYRVLAAILIGQQFYDKIAGNTGQLYDIHEAALKMQQTNALGGINISAELPSSIIKEQKTSASLPHYFEQAHNTNKTACIYIINDKTVAFIPTQQGITLLESATTMEPVEHLWPWLQQTQHGNCSPGLKL